MNLEKRKAQPRGDRYVERIVLVKCDEDWYIIEKAEHPHEEWLEVREWGYSYQHSGRISDAEVEGPLHQMKGLAQAILDGGEDHHKRCACRVDGDTVRFWSPRNSRSHAVVPLTEAVRWAQSVLNIPEDGEGDGPKP